jgi:peptidoglycan hydrolase-like protein with peptidoglycan-binding domain
LRITSFVCSAFLFYLAWAMPSIAGQRAASSRGKAVASSSKKKQAVKSGRHVIARKRSAPRQSTPTPERYREIQQALADKGYAPGPVDGTWGPEWVDAVKKFQADQNLSVDGKLGALSLIALGLGPNRETTSHLAGKPESIE